MRRQLHEAIKMPIFRTYIRPSKSTNLPVYSSTAVNRASGATVKAATSIPLSHAKLQICVSSAIFRLRRTSNEETSCRLARKNEVFFNRNICFGHFVVSCICRARIETKNQNFQEQICNLRNRSNVNWISKFCAAHSSLVHVRARTRHTNVWVWVCSVFDCIVYRR